MKKVFKFMFSLALTVLAFVMGAGNGVLMANATPISDGAGGTAGVTKGGEGGINQNLDGMASETQGRADGDPEFYTKHIDKLITKIRPMATPIDQISRYAKAQSCDSFEVKYYSVGTRPVKCKLTKKVALTSGSSVAIDVDDVNMFTKDDTIRVVGVKAITDSKGMAYDPNDPKTPDLVLSVCGKDELQRPVVYAINGNKNDNDGQPIWFPEIDHTKVTLIRMGKACGEIDVQTGRFNNLPTAEVQYCQNFMIQVEQSFMDRIAGKEVDWNFTDIEEDSIQDMRLAQENSYLFGDKAVINHPSKEGGSVWFTKGIWWMAGKDVEIGHYDTEKQCAVISDEDLVNISKDLFVGTGTGNKRKVIFAGSDALAAFSKIESEKFRLKESVEVWKLKFKSWETDFGEILVMHHELFDMNGMSDCAFALDPDYLAKMTHVSWSRNILDLKQAGVRNTQAVVLQEVACLYLRYAPAHARMKLATA